MEELRCFPMSHVIGNFVGMGALFLVVVVLIVVLIFKHK